MQSTGLTVLWFLLIIGLIPLSLWVLKRSGMVVGTVPGQEALIKPVTHFNLGPGQKLVTVEVGSGDDRKWLVLGVTAQQITTLHIMAPQADLPAAASAGPTTAFASLLRKSSHS